MGLPTIPYDPWFDPKHNYVPFSEHVIDLLDGEPFPINDRFDLYGSSECDDAYTTVAEKTIHEEMYELAIQNGKHWLGGSENVFSN